MNCHDAQELLDDFVDGTIPEGDRREVARHMETCPECRTSEARMRTLLAGVRALPRSVEPPRDPWPGIVDRIMAGKVIERDFAGRGRRWYLLAAAAVAAAVLIATISLTTAVLVRNDRGSRVAAAPGRPGTVAVSQASFGLAQAKATYAAARVQLLAALEVRKGALSPQTVDVVEKNLRIIDQAVSEMEAALARDPGNREIPALLVASYQQEIDLLQRVTLLPERG